MTGESGNLTYPPPPAITPPINDIMCWTITGPSGKVSTSELTFGESYVPCSLILAIYLALQRYNYLVLLSVIIRQILKTLSDAYKKKKIKNK